MDVVKQNIDCIEIMCNYLLHNFFLENTKTWVGPINTKRSKTGNSLGAPTSEDLRQTSNWSKLVAAYLPVALLTILDRLVDDK